VVWLIALAGAAGLLTSCNPDPTSSGFTFQFLNDTPGAVTVRYCDDSHCHKADWTEVVAAGKTLKANTSAEGFDEWYQFLSRGSGAVIGCKTLKFKHKKLNLVVPISSATACS
jgi:hypothetical protein